MARLVRQYPYAVFKILFPDNFMLLCVSQSSIYSNRFFLRYRWLLTAIILPFAVIMA